MQPSLESKPNFDPTHLISKAFGYLKHFRLMLIMLAFGLLAGISYFLFAIPTFQARSLVYYQAFGTAVKDSEVQAVGGPGAGLSRGLLTRFSSQRIQLGAARRLGLLGEEETYEDLLENVPGVRVNIVDSQHLEVTVLAYDPEIVKTFCQAMIDEFREFQESSWTEFRDEALERYALQLTELEEKVRDGMTSLSQMEREQQLTEVTIEQQSLLEIPKQLVETRERIFRMEEVSRELGKLDETDSEDETDEVIAVLSLLSSFEKEAFVKVGDLVRRPNGTMPVVSSKSTQTVVQPKNVEGIESWRELEKQKRILETEIKDAAVKFLPDHPRMKELTGKLVDAKRALAAEMKVLREKFQLEYEQLQQKQINLEARMPEYLSVTEELGLSSQAYSSIEQTQDMWNKARIQLSDKLAAITFSEENDWVQMRFKGHTSLRDEIPLSPNKMKIIILSTMIGVAGALGIPTLLNFFDTSATNVYQLEDYTGLKGIGVVPLSKKSELENVNRSQAQGSSIPNYLLECFRIIRASIIFNVKPGEQSQVVLVTSARPQEGKTTIAANLAWAFFSLGERVLLVDCDLRRGRQHGLLGIENQVGVTTVLMSEISPSDAIVNTGLEGFDVIPRGPVIPGATELLGQDGFKDTVNKWREEYDRVILDCPPVLGLSESGPLQRLADGTVLVIRAETTSRKDVGNTINFLQKAGAHMFGFVLNSVDLSKAGNYYHYYYYSAPYYDQLDAETQGHIKP